MSKAGYKPGSVLHQLQRQPSILACSYPQAQAATPEALGPATPPGLCPGTSIRPCSRRGLPGHLVTQMPVGSYPTISPLLPSGSGVFSVALSLGLPPLGVTQRPAVWSPDFPLAQCASGCPPALDISSTMLSTRRSFILNLFAKTLS